MSRTDPLQRSELVLDPATPHRANVGTPTGKKHSPPPPSPAGTPGTADASAWTVRVLRSDSEFAALEAAWSELHARCADRNVFLSHEWLHAWWVAYRPRAELAIVIVEDGGRLLGIAPMMIGIERSAGVGVRVLRFIGDANEATGHVRETDHAGFVVDRAQRAEVVHALLAAIARLRWDAAELNQVPEASETTRDLLHWIALMKLAHSVEAVPCPVRRLPPTYEALLASLPSRLRTSVRSSRRRLANEHALEFGLHADDSGIAAALARFFENHTSRWRGKGQQGAFAQPARREFYRMLTPRLLRRGWLRFFYLALDGRVVAQQYCFAVDDTVMLLQEGFDFAHAQDNVGNVLRACVFEHLIAAGAGCYDFLAGSSRHKQAWSDGVVTDLRIECARPTWRGRLRRAVPAARQRIADLAAPCLLRLRARRSTKPANDE
jgi:CelD/BcsL family acetyltransferase involved in cellulose biosynthesis